MEWLKQALAHKVLKKQDIDLEFINFQLGTEKYPINEKKAKKLVAENWLIDPIPTFSCEDYLYNNPDVMASGIHPYVHYIKFGKKEARGVKNSKQYDVYFGVHQVSKETNEQQNITLEETPASIFFNSIFYNNKYPGAWGWEHYLSHGQHENKIPNKDVIPEALEAFFRDESEQPPLVNMYNFAQTLEQNKCSDKPVYSIVILNWNKSLMTLQCVYTILKNSYYTDIEIIVVDNGSMEHDYVNLLELAKVPCVKVIRNNSNRFYGEANNIGVEAANGEYICLLNNDAFVHKYWDKHLIEKLESDDSIGGVGPKFLFPDGRLQEAGGELNPCGQNVQIGKGLDASLDAFNVEYEVSHVSAACFMLRKDLFYRVNGFDYRYEPAYFEDADLTAKIKSIGLSIWYVPQSQVIHVENATSKDENIGFQFGSLISTNRLKFVARWSEYLRGGESPYIPDFSREYAARAELERKDAKIAVVYSPYNLTPGGGERYVLNLALSAVKSGYKTYFCSPDTYSSMRLFTIGHELGVDTSEILLINEYQLNTIKEVELFIAMSNELSPKIQAIGTKRNIYHCQFPFPMSDWHKANCLENVLGYDEVIVNSEFTRNAFLQEGEKFGMKLPTVSVVSPPVEILSTAEKPKNLVRILNVGRFIAGGHCKKQKELLQAFEVLSQKLEELGIESELLLVGALSSSQEDRDYLSALKMNANDNVKIILNASRQEVIDYYKSAHFYWHGTGMNEDVKARPEVFEHFGITPIEAISAGCIPVVWHEGGPAHTMEKLYSNPERFLAHSIDEYADKTIALLDDSDLVHASLDIFSEQQFYNVLNDKIK